MAFSETATTAVKEARLIDRVEQLENLATLLTEKVVGMSEPESVNSDRVISASVIDAYADRLSRVVGKLDRVLVLLGKL